MRKVLDFNKFTKGRGDHSDLVPCARCGKMINMYAVKCPLCGVNFQGRAYQFSPPKGLEETKRGRLRNRIIALILIITLFMILVLLRIS